MRSETKTRNLRACQSTVRYMFGFPSASELREECFYLADHYHLYELPTKHPVIEKVAIVRFWGGAGDILTEGAEEWDVLYLLIETHLDCVEWALELLLSSRDGYVVLVFSKVVSRNEFNSSLCLIMLTVLYILVRHMIDGGLSLKWTNFQCFVHFCGGSDYVIMDSYLVWSAGLLIIIIKVRFYCSKPTILLYSCSGRRTGW